jgi:hypothetical protein
LCYLIKVWGPFDLRDLHGRSLRPSVRKSCALLAILALSDGHRQSRKWLQSRLWSESDEGHAAGSLRQEILRLKRLLGDAIGADNLDVWLAPGRFDFDHLPGNASGVEVELLQGMDVPDESFEDWLRDQRQARTPDPKEARTAEPSPGPAPHGARGRGTCLVLFECDTRGSLDANIAAMFCSEWLYRKLKQYDVFTCIGSESGADADMTEARARGDTAVVRIVAIADREEVCVGVQVDRAGHGPRLGYRSAILPRGMTRLRDAPELGRLVEETTDTLLSSLEDEGPAQSATIRAAILSHEARKLTFRLDRESLARADRLLKLSYQIEPRGQFLAWRAFLRNSAFFQHRRTDIFDETLSADALSLEAMAQSPNDAMVQAFSAQLEYVNQGNLVEPLIKAERAVELDRSDPLARALLSNALTVNGRLEEGLEVALQSVELSRDARTEFYFHHFACMAATAAGRYQTALKHARTSVSFSPDFVSPRRYEVALAQRLGDRPGVRRAVDAMRRMEPDFAVPSLLDPTYPVNTLRRLPIIDAIR